MAKFCAQCGTSLAAGANFCPECGTPSADDAARTGAAAAAGPPPTIPGTSGSVGSLDTNVACLLCYALTFVTGIVFLVLEPYQRNPVIRFHAWQSIIFGVIWVGVSTIGMVILFALQLGFLSPLIVLGLFAVWVLLMAKAYGGEKFKLPIIGDLAEQQAAKA